MHHSDRNGMNRIFVVFPKRYTANDSRVGRLNNGGQKEDKRAPKLMRSDHNGVVRGLPCGCGVSLHDTAQLSLYQEGSTIFFIQGV